VSGIDLTQADGKRLGSQHGQTYLFFSPFPVFLLLDGFDECAFQFFCSTDGLTPNDGWLLRSGNQGKNGQRGTGLFPSDGGSRRGYGKMASF
jgi:hypothetical protein